MLLVGKSALITGGARGIGLAVARAFVQEGARVMLADIEAATLEAAGRDVGAETVLLDVTDRAATESAAERAVALFGAVDVVVPNAGILVLRRAVDLADAEWRRVLEVNLTGAFITATSFARRMGAGGRIILTSSLFGLRGGAENAAYSASKFGVVGLMQSLAAELAPRGILVNCVCPGQIDTAMLRGLFEERAAAHGRSADELKRAFESRIPAGYLGRLDELAGTYVYLASRLSAYVTGQSITVDGGWQVG